MTAYSAICKASEYKFRMKTITEQIEKVQSAAEYGSTIYSDVPNSMSKRNDLLSDNIL